MQIELTKFLGETRFQGQPRGTRHFAKVCEALSGIAPGETVYLDFGGAEVLTGSWISAMLIQLLRWATNPEIELFFVLCNIQDKDLIDELRYVAHHARVVFLVASSKTPSRSAAVVGPLDPGQRETLSAILKAGQSTGAELERLYPESNVKATAWNNRLKDLYNKRLLMRSKHGREQVYRTVAQEIYSMGENFIEEQVKHFEKRRRIAHNDVKRRSFFEQPEITNAVYTVNVNYGSDIKEGETYLASVSRDGQRIDVVDGHRVVGRIEGDGAKNLAKGLGESGDPGVIKIRVTEVSSLSGCGKAVIVKDE